ncbi:hypothetical protein Tco_0947530 [Tanacetum coccineum]
MMVMSLRIRVAFVVIPDIQDTVFEQRTQVLDLINQVNLKSVEISNLNASLQEKVLVITALKEDLGKLKGKALVDNAVTEHTIDPEMLKIDEEATVLRDLVEHVKANYPLDHPLESACSLQGNTKKDKIQQTPSSTQKNKVEAHPRKDKSSLKNKDCVVAPKGTAYVQHSKLNANSELKCVKCNGCMLSDNLDLCVLDFINNNASVKSKSVVKSSKRKVWKLTGKMFTNIGYIWRPTGRTFTIVGNAYPLTRITTTTEVPLRKPTALDNETPKLVVTLVYSRKPRKSKTNVPISKSKVLKSVYANKKEPSQSWGSIVSDVPSSSLDECRASKLFSGTVKFGNDHVAKILGYGDYQIGNVTISRVYYVEGLGHNLFSVGHFCDDSTLNVLRFSSTTPASFVSGVHICYLTNVSEILGSSGPTLHEMTHATISLGLVPHPHCSTAFVPPSRTDCDLLFQSLFDELLTPPSKDNHYLDVAQMNNNPFFGIPIPEKDSEASSSSDIIPTVVHTAAPNSEHVTKWTKDHLLENIISELERPVYKTQLH